MAKSIFPTLQSYYEGTRWDYRWVWGVRNTYALHFGYYDEQATYHKAAVANMNKVMADLAAIQAGEKVLDAGCGVGGSSIWLAQNRNCTTVGVTPIESQVKDALGNARRQSVSARTSFLLADYHKVPFEDGSFDVVWALESVCHAERKLDFYQEAARLLRPGGRLVIAEYVRKQRPYSEENEFQLRRWLNNWAIPDLDTVSEHAAHAQKTGLVDFTFRDITQHTMRSILNIKEHGYKWLPIALSLNKWGIVSDVQISNVWGSIHQYHALEKKLWCYGLLSATKPA